jgi:hypothetical protein
MWNRIVGLVVLFASLVVGTAELRAGGMVINRIDGTIGQFTLTSPNPNINMTAVLAFPTITTTMFNGQAVPAGIVTQLDSFIINRTPIANGPAGYTTFAVIAPGLTDAYQFRFTTLMPGGSGASFGLFGNSVTPPAFQPNAILIPNNATNTVMVTTTGIPRRNGNANYDFTNIRTFSLTVTAPNVQGQPVNLANIIQNGGMATGSGTFFLSSVPEPSSVVLLALGTLGLATTVARRSRHLAPER